MFEDYENEDFPSYYWEEQRYWEEVAAEDYFQRKAISKISGIADVDEAYIDDEFERFHRA